MNSKHLFLFLCLLSLNLNLTLLAQEDEETNDPKPEVKQQGIKAYSKYDFTPGEQVIFYENFESDAIGDFPARWNTNGSGEVVTLEGYEGKWFKMIPEASFILKG